eukprot:gnl/MRDRNA2_/MRDRNA2_99877_c0_seq1.p1 gnl/MRDRNA2_/MRDRNA2_99877_c0~~gnl/MRDRNA2_/MRDRNA2_99877_c0_seq1.p1  ORF type:complete len:400 (-),score=46.31 gnl/MRDRNA2_/MRDRNA2_99877_c0_seq1:48-1247(-)
MCSIDAGFEPGHWECATDGGWTAYHWLTAVTIESAWRAGLPCVEFLDRDMHYKIEFNRSGVPSTTGSQTVTHYEMSQCNIRTSKQRKVRRWPSWYIKDKIQTDMQQAEVAKARSAWKSWDAADWSWPLQSYSGGLVPLNRQHSPAFPEPPQVKYTVHDGSVLHGFSFPLNQLPSSALLCIHPSAENQYRANFALQRLLPIAQTDVCQSEWDWLLSQWIQGGLDDKYHLVGALRIMNRGLLTGFAALRIAMQAKLQDQDDFLDGVDRNQKLTLHWLWHGCKTVDRLYQICREGFDRSYATTCAYGKGCYFATKAKMSNSYATDCCADELSGKLRALLLSAVLVGEITRGSRDGYPAPLKPHSRNGERYENTVDDVAHPNIFVTYKDHQALPCYIMVYKER